MVESGTLVYEEERKVLSWFDAFLDNASDSFKTSAFYFKKYYEQCVENLIKLGYSKQNKRDIEVSKLDSIYADDIEDFKENRSYNKILVHMKKNISFMKEVMQRGILSEEDVRNINELPVEKLSKMTKEEVCALLKDGHGYVEAFYNNDVDNFMRSRNYSDEVVDESLVPCLKMHRLNNLQVKFAHTARVVYLTDFEVRKLGVDNELVRSILYTSALFHDVGRFYQGTYYNSYTESDLRNTENQHVHDHAEAGYYYSLLDMINLNILGASTDEDLIIHSIASAVVKKHQLPNSLLNNYDKMISNFEFNDSVKEEMLNFLISCYGKSKKFDGGIHGRFQKSAPGSSDSMRESFTNSMLDVISAYTGVDDVENVRNAIYGLFDYESPNLVLDDENVSILRKCLTGKELEILEERISKNQPVLLSPLYNHLIKDYKIKQLLGEDTGKANSVRLFMNKLIETSTNNDYYQQYDIVDTIDKVMEANGRGERYEGIELNEDIAKVLRMSMGLVMDMDKLDILVQRAIKRYPGWKPDSITVKTLTKDSDKGIEEDESLIDVLENQFNMTIEYDETGRIVLDDVLIDVIKHCANVNGEFKKKFGNFDFSTLTAGTVVDSNTDEILKSSYGGKNVSMPYDIMEKAFPDLAERYRIEMDLVLPQDLRENVFKVDEERNYRKGSNGAVTAFPLGAKATDSDHFCWGNAFPGVWWQLDQFVMTNMRSMESLRFIRETGLLDRIGDAYKSEDCPKEFGMFVDEAINFSKDFIDMALGARINQNGDMIFNEEQEGYSPVILSDKDTMIKIRNEAAIRYQDKRKKENVREAAKDELDAMFDNERGNNYQNNLETEVTDNLSRMVSETSQNIDTLASSNDIKK